MQPFDRHSAETRKARISEATSQYRNLTRAAEENHRKAVMGEATELPHDYAIASKLVPGAEFISACEIRVVPKVQPQTRYEMRSALMQSRVFIPGIRFRIDGIAMVKSSGKDANGKKLPGKQWYRVSVVSPRGKTLHRGFILETAIRGQIAAPLPQSAA